MDSEIFFYSVKQTYKMLGISASTFQTMRKRGEFVPAIRLTARRVVFDRASVRAWVAAKVAA